MNTPSHDGMPSPENRTLPGPEAIPASALDARAAHASLWQPHPAPPPAPQLPDGSFLELLMVGGERLQSPQLCHEVKEMMLQTCPQRTSTLCVFPLKNPQNWLCFSAFIRNLPCK